MILCWGRHGKAGGCRSKKRIKTMTARETFRVEGGLAQLGEHLPCKQGVESSNLLVSTAGEPAKPYLENRIPRHRHPRSGKAGGPPERNGKDNENQRRNEREAAGPHARGRRPGSSWKGRGADALALGADERRDKLRKAAGSGTCAKIRRFLNGETHAGKTRISAGESIARGGEPGELKHLSSRRRRKQK